MGDALFLRAKFCGDVDFKKVVFKGLNASFNVSEFLGKASFRESEINRGSFTAVRFEKEVSFVDATFLSFVTFNSAIFQDSATFGEAKFYCGFMGGVALNGARFEKKCVLYDTRFDEWEMYYYDRLYTRILSYSTAVFIQKHLQRFHQFLSTVLGKFRLEDYFEKHCPFPSFVSGVPDQITMKNTYFSDVYGLIEMLEKTKKVRDVKKNRTEILCENVQISVGDQTANRHPVVARQIRDDWFLMNHRKKHPFWNFLWWLFADCGRTLLRWVGWSLFAAIYFSFNFFLIDYSFSGAFHFSDAIQDKTIWSYIYYSIVTFTTLGFGDIIPTMEWVQRWVMAEVITGYVMLGGLISILANKLARRS